MFLDALKDGLIFSSTIFGGLLLFFLAVAAILYAAANWGIFGFFGVAFVITTMALVATFYIQAKDDEIRRNRN